MRKRVMKCPFCHEKIDVNINYTLDFNEKSKPTETLKLEPVKVLKDRKILGRMVMLFSPLLLMDMLLVADSI